MIQGEKMSAAVSATALAWTLVLSLMNASPVVVPNFVSEDACNKAAVTIYQTLNLEPSKWVCLPTMLSR
jgi:hypothetical protein